VERPSDFLGEAEFSVRPGAHLPRVGEHSVVWWDPSVLRLEVEGNLGLRQEEFLEPGPRAEAGLEQYQAWQRRRAQTLEQGSRPRFELFTASEAAADPPDFTCPVEIETIARSGERPAGRRFGSLVHQVLRDIALDGGAASALALARMHARLLGASAEEADAAAEAAAAALAHPLLERARRAERRHREWPVLLKLEDGKLLEGVIDLAFLEQDTWVIVDFKSDADLKAHRDHYFRQLRWYALALTRTTRLQARGILLGV
jgi:ATP-dependent exoDNAse (exonuclease V) beta subunit